jgi:hypothetical protein
MSAARWQLEREKARLLDARAEVSIDLAHPERGLSVIVPDMPTTGPRLSVLGFALGDAQRDRLEIDAYVRQNDLVATFERVEPQPMRAQVYWRWLEPSEFAPDFAAAVLVAFDLIASVNTSLLDADPMSRAGSLIEPVAAFLNLTQDKSGNLHTVQLGSLANRRDGAARRIARNNSDTGCFIARIAVGSHSWVEMVHPTDFRGSQATFSDSNSLPDHDAVGLSHDLFEQRLEKGVILRARIRAALVKQDHDSECANAALDRFSSAEPPLTV